MKGFIGRAVALLGWSAALAGVGGCHTYRDIVDPCYPERYWYASRQNVNAAFAPQVHNGHVLDQSVWNYHFEDGSDRLTVGGQTHLAYLARRRPHPDPCLYLQTAHDLAYDQDKPTEFPAKRSELDQKRIVAIKNYLAAQTAGGKPVDFQVYVHNPPPDIGLAAVPVDNAIRQLYASPRATLPGTGGVTASGGGGAR